VNTAGSPKFEQITGKTLIDMSKQQISTCYQCQKCSNSCPMAFAMDIIPHEVIHKIQLGLIDELINSDTIWVCASCITCTARCPNDIDIAHVMDTLRHLSVKRGVKVSQKQAPIFHKAFMSNIRNLGKMHEMTMALDFTLKSAGLKGLIAQSKLGMNLLFKGKMKLAPHFSHSRIDIRKIFQATEEKS
jgi:heterodisulfide reductase subunit C